MPGKTVKRAFLTRGEFERVHTLPMYPSSVETAFLILSQIKPSEAWNIEFLEIPNPNYKPKFPKPPKAEEAEI